MTSKEPTRRRSFRQPKSRTLHVRFTEETLCRVEMVASADRIALSDFAREAIEEKLARRFGALLPAAG